MVIAWLAGCGGGSSGDTLTTDGPTDAQRAAAAQSTAANNPLCSPNVLGPYYWEIGNVNGRLVSGTAGNGTVTADTPLNIASASKLPFAAYVVQKYGDVPSNRPYLHFTSGWSNLDNSACASVATVADCMNGAQNTAEAAAGTFHYQGGHMQELGLQLGLGALRIDALNSELRAQLGSDVGFGYIEPLLPGGLRASANQYAAFLRKLLVGSPNALALGPLLGSSAVCTQPSATCNASTETAAALPENFHYSLGHWVEDDPTTTPATNFAYSSAGKFGFYPWVDTSRTLYGIVAREDQTLTTGEGYSSLRCGRLIRLAWKTGVTQ